MVRERIQLGGVPVSGAAMPEYPSISQLRRVALAKDRR